MPVVRTEYSLLSPDGLSNRNDVMSDKANLRSDITLNIFIKKIRASEFVGLIKQFGAIAF